MQTSSSWVARPFFLMRSPGLGSLELRLSAGRQKCPMNWFRRYTSHYTTVPLYQSQTKNSELRPILTGDTYKCSWNYDTLVSCAKSFSLLRNVFFVDFGSARNWYVYILYTVCIYIYIYMHMCVYIYIWDVYSKARSCSFCRIESRTRREVYQLERFKAVFVRASKGGWRSSDPQVMSPNLWGVSPR